MGRGRFYNACNIDGKHFKRAQRQGLGRRRNHLQMHVEKGEITDTKRINLKNMRNYLHVCRLTEEECKVQHVAKRIFPRDC